MRTRFLIVALAYAGLALGGHALGSPETSGDPQAGEKLVQKNGCTGCHGAKFQGGIGPKLVGIERLLSAAQITDFIKHPRSVMPDFGFSDSQIADIVAYLSTLDGGVAGVPVVTVEPATPREHATLMVRFVAVPKSVMARVSMQMGTVSHLKESALHPTTDPHVWQGELDFTMAGAWTLTLIYDGKTLDVPLTVVGGT
ncbi:MAG: hypothetical protein NVSMB31_14370 [Vulcanimicrobiaceae bacterium]